MLSLNSEDIYVTLELQNILHCLNLLRHTSCHINAPYLSNKFGKILLMNMCESCMSIHVMSM